MKATIITGGRFEYMLEHHEQYFQNDRCIIAVDGGVAYSKENGIIPDIALGDFDTCPSKILEEMKKSSMKVVKYPAKKDRTDTEIAIDFVIESKASEVAIFGGIGTRMDHTLANVHLLHKFLEAGIEAKLIDKNNVIRLINNQIKINKEGYPYLSLIPLTTSVEGITTKGLAYELDEANLKIGSSLGVSNEIINEVCEIKIKYGELIIIQSID